MKVTKVVVLTDGGLRITVKDDAKSAFYVLDLAPEDMDPNKSRFVVPSIPNDYVGTSDDKKETEEVKLDD